MGRGRLGQGRAVRCLCHNETAVASQGTILIVDDEPAMRFSLSRAFLADHRIIEAASTEEARRQLERLRQAVLR